MQLADAGEQVRGRAGLRVVGAALVGVLAVAQLAFLDVGVGALCWEGVLGGGCLALGAGGRAAGAARVAPAGVPGEPGGDRGVVAGGAGEGSGGEALARCQREPPVALAQLGEHGLVVGGVDDDGGEGAVLGGGADHRGAADIDVLDRLGRRWRQGGRWCARRGRG